MSSIDPFVEYATSVGLKSRRPVDVGSRIYMFHAGDYGLTISDWTEPGGSKNAIVDVILAFGLSPGREPDDIASLRMRYNHVLRTWQLKYELKGDEPPSEIRAIAMRYRLVDSDQPMALVDEQAHEIGFAMIDCIHIIRTRRRSDPFLSLLSAPRPT